MTDSRDTNPMSDFRARAITIGINLSWILVAMLLIESIRLDVLAQPTVRSSTVGLAALLAGYNLIPWESVVHRTIGKILLLAWAAVVLLALSAARTVEAFGDALLGPYLAAVVFVAVIARTRTLILFTCLSIASYVTVPLYLGHELQATSMLVPMLSLIGVALVTRAATISLSTSLGTVADQRSQLARKDQNFERLYEVSRTIAAGEDLEDVLPELVGRIGSYLGCEVGLILLNDSSSTSLHVVSPIWANGHSLEIAGYRIGLQTRDALAETFLTQQPKIITGIGTAPDDFGLLGELGLSDAMVTVLKVDRTPLGLLVLGDKRDGAWSEADLDDLVSLGAPAALVLAQLDRYAEVSSAGRKMEELARMKSDFVSVVSHELRTPLTSIIGALATLARPELAPEHEAAQQLLDSARNQTDRLRRLIEDLLMVSRLENGALPQNPVSVDLGALIAAIVEEIPGASELVTFSVHERIEHIEVDADHLHRVLINLVQNAIKYANGSDIEVMATPRGGGQISIAVVDHGPGISEQQKSAVFDRFTQLEPSATRSQGGTGLGLNIVRGLVESMGGLIEIVDTPGGGATFNVILPRAPGSLPLTSIQVLRG